VKNLVIAAGVLAITIPVCFAQNQISDIPLALLACGITAFLVLVSCKMGKNSWVAAWIMFLAAMSYGGQLSFVNVIIAPAVGFLALDALMNAWGKIPKHVIWLGLVAPLIWVIAIASGNRFDINYLYHHIEAYLFAIWVALNREKGMEIRAAVLYLAILVAFGSLESIFDYSSRLRGPYGSATAYGATLEAFLATCVLWGIYRRTHLRLLAILGGLALVCMLMTGTRSAVVGLGFAVAAGLLLKSEGEHVLKRIIKRGVILLIIALVVGAVWSLLPDSLMLKQTFGAISASKRTIDISAMGRIAAWWVVIKTFPTHPFMGNGLGQFQYLFAKYFTFIWLPHAHNIFMATLVDLGLLGLTVLLGLLGGGVSSLWRWKNSNQAMMVGCIGTSILVVGQFDFIPLYPSLAMWGGFFLGWAYKQDS
jgi:O-antigen ligase